MGDLEALKTVASLSFLSGNIEDRVNELSSFRVVSLGPVIACSGLSEDKIVGSEKLTKRSSSNRVHGSWFEIHKDGSGDVPASSCLVVVDINPLELQIGIAVVGSGGVDSVLIRDDFPEFGTNLVAALTSLDVDDLSHVKCL